MSAYAIGPSLDEVEVVLFGPGFGEAILVHLGQGDWLAVDSCLEPSSKKPASAEYLRSIGVSYDRVKVIVASHWHDDHVRGIAEFAKLCPAAEFHMSAVFSRDEAMAFLLAHSAAQSTGLGRGCSELHAVVSARSVIQPDQARSLVYERDGQIRVTAFSPVPAAFAEMIQGFAALLPSTSGGSSIRNAVPLKPNMEAVALHLDFGSFAVLLGSDLEDHPRYGWTAVINDPICAAKLKSSLYKVAHHGSITGHHDGQWSVLLENRPVSIATPFNRGSKRLPDPDDRNRIRSLSRASFITSNATRKPQLDPAQLKRLSQIATNVVPVNSGFGTIRMRRRFNEVEWRSEVFNSAEAL